MREEAQLLEELSRLIDRYGADRFTQLAILLKNPETAANLAAVLDHAVTSQARKPRRKRPSSKSPAGARILGHLQEKDTEKYEVLVAFRDAFLARKLLPSFQHIRRFAGENGIQLGSVNTRDKAITPL